MYHQKTQSIVSALNELGVPGSEEVLQYCTNARMNKKLVVFTHGAFDVLHLGHIVYLEAARKLGDVLVVGVHADEPVSFYKGEGRPILPLIQRAKIIDSLKVVDYVMICWHSTAEDVVRILHPDVYVKDSGYDIRAMPEARMYKSMAGYYILCRTQRVYPVPRL